MDRTFFGLAVLAALNPKLLGADLLLIDNRRPRIMFAAFLAGGLAMGISVGLLNVFVFDAGAARKQGTVSAGIELALGVVLLVVGALVATRRLPRRTAASAKDSDATGEKKRDWAQRVLSEPRPGLAFLVGLLMGTPGGSYLAALAHLEGSGDSKSLQALAVVLFNLIQFSVVIVPLLLLELRPEATRRRLRGLSDWLGAHARVLVAGIVLLVGAYMTISGAVRLL